MDMELGGAAAEDPSEAPAAAPPTRVTPQFIAQFFINKGVPVPVATGWAQRLMLESSGNPLAVNKTSGALGLAQDLGSRKERLLRLPDWRDPTVQLENIWQEMHGGDPQATHALPAMLAQTSPSAAYAMFTKNFERPGPSGGGAPSSEAPSSEPVPDAMFRPISQPPPPPAPKVVVNFPAAGPLRAGNERNPYLMLSLLQLMMRGHSVQPVDYDPWKLVPPRIT